MDFTNVKTAIAEACARIADNSNVEVGGNLVIDGKLVAKDLYVGETNYKDLKRAENSIETNHLADVIDLGDLTSPQ